MVNQRGIPGCPMFEHGIDDRQQLPHAGSPGHLLGFAGGAQALIEDANRRKGKRGQG